jgi:hypothetical protein
VKAEGTRRRLYPRLIELQRRHRKDRVTLQQKTAELYRAENSSQFAGFLPVLAQIPVLSVVYTLFVRITIDGHANTLLDHQLFSAPLGGSFLQIGSGGSGSILVYLVLFAVLAVVAAIHPSTQLAAVRDHRLCGDRASGRSLLPGSVGDVDPGGAETVAPLVLGRSRTCHPGVVDPPAITTVLEVPRCPVRGEARHQGAALA